jgi:hypothetical protein
VLLLCVSCRDAADPPNLDGQHRDCDDGGEAWIPTPLLVALKA